MLSPSTCTTRPSMGGHAATTSWSIRPKVAPTWSAIPACAGPARTSAARAVVAAALKNDRRPVDTEDLPQRVTDLAERDLRADGVEDERDEVVPAARGPVHGLERARRGPGVATAPEAVQALGHRRAHGGIDLEEAAG